MPDLRGGTPVDTRGQQRVWPRTCGQLVVGGGSGGGSARAPGGSDSTGTTAQTRAPRGARVTQPGTGGVKPGLRAAEAAPAPAPNAGPGCLSLNTRWATCSA